MQEMGAQQADSDCSVGQSFLTNVFSTVLEMLLWGTRMEKVT